MTDEEMQNIITHFANRTDKMGNRFAQMKGMAGMVKMARQGGAIGMYQEMQSVASGFTEDVEETDLLGSLLEALDEGDDDDTSSLDEVVASYLEMTVTL